MEKWLHDYFLGFYHPILFGVFTAFYFLRKRYKRLSQIPTWLILGVYLTLFTIRLGQTLWMGETGDWGGGSTGYGYPFQILILRSRHYWVSHVTVYEGLIHPLQFTYNLLFYTVSSLIVSKIALRIDKRVQFNSTQKAGVIIGSPYVFFQGIRLLTTPFTSHEYSELFGSRLFDVIRHLNEGASHYLDWDWDPSRYLLVIFIVGVIIVFVGLFKTR